MAMIAMQPWCAVFQWPSKAPFLLGTIVLPVDTPFHLLEQAAKELFDQQLQAILPDSYDRPKLIDLRQGALFFA